jgi:hypothetical protein
MACTAAAIAANASVPATDCHSAAAWNERGRRFNSRVPNHDIRK